jgi:hypothetical protein
VSDQGEGFQAIYDALVRKHDASGDPVRLALVRGAARLLAQDSLSASDAAAASGLLDRLAAFAEPEQEPEWDLSRLSERQLAILEKLGRVATGQTMTRLEQRPYSVARWNATDAYQLIDRITARDRWHPSPTEDERRELMNCFTAMISAMGMAPSAFWRGIYKPSEPRAEPEHIESKPEPLPDRTNVVDLVDRVNAPVVSLPLEDRYPHLRDGRKL